MTDRDRDALVEVLAYEEEGRWSWQHPTIVAAARLWLAQLSKSSRTEPMPRRFEQLARYNGEVARGIVHTQEWKARMIYLQGEFDRWAVSTAPFGTTAVISYPTSAIDGGAKS